MARDDSPLSFLQERIWFNCQLLPGHPIFNLAVSLSLRGPLDVAALRRALNAVVERHETLRTSFPTRDGQPVQHVADPFQLPLLTTDLSGPDAAGRDGTLRRALADHATRAFDLAAGPLLRAHLYRLDADDHVLALAMHHIISDGWSMAILFNELAHHYRADNPPLPSLPIQYADYATWQRQWLTGATLHRQLDYWRRQLHNTPPLLELPTDHPRPPIQTYNGDRLSFTLPTALTQQLHHLARTHNATVFIVLTTALATLLHRYTGQTDICIGTPVANRTRVETEPLIGFFVNSLVLRVDTAGNPTYAQLLRQVRDTALGAYDHQDLPFERLVQELRPQRSLSHTPLFQVQAVYESHDWGVPLAGLDVEVSEVDAGTAKTDLTFSFHHDGERIRGEVEYSTDLFEPPTVQRMINHLCAVLAATAADPGQRLDHIRMLDDAERHQVLIAWNDTDAPVTDGRLVHQQIADRARGDGAGRPAVTTGGDTLTYGQLHRRANQLAHHLRALGVGPDDIVATYLPRSTELVIAFLATLTAGAAYLPLDPANPAGRTAHLLEDARPVAVLTTVDLAHQLPAAVTAVVLDRDAAAIERRPGHPPAAAVHPDHLAYVIYTSGSTGRPKGVMVTHRGIANHMRWLLDAYPLDRTDAVVQRTPLSFDPSIWELLAPLMAGARLVVAPGDAHRDPAALVDLVVAEDVTVLQVVPTLLRILIEHGGLARCTSLRRVVSGGESLHGELYRQLSEISAAELVNMYGPAEASIQTTTLVWTPEFGHGVVPIGRPVTNTQTYILDSRLQPVPPGTVGELHLAGTQLARGYLHQPAHTADRFLPHPHTTQPGQRLYRTGDLARHRPDGTIEYIGRTDHQTKLHGFRIELDEIDTTLRTHPHIREATTISREDQPGDRRLTSYVTPNRHGDRPTAWELRRFLAESLPEHMVPAAFVVLDALPLNASGKVDRHALPAPGGDRQELDRDYAAPETALEHAVADLFAAVLRIERVGADDHFFELGGHSLLATQVVVRLRQTLGISAELRTLFQHPTVRGFAARLGELEPEFSLRVPIPVRPRDGDQPASLFQERMWFLEQLTGSVGGFTIPEAVRLRGPLDVTALHRALNAVVERHETLRTSFPTRDGQPVQRIAAHHHLPLEVTDLSTLDADGRDRTLHRALAGHATQPFDLATGPLVRAHLYRLDADDHVLALAMHHIISDGWSMGVLFNELTHHYRNRTLPPLPIQYADYATWQRQWLTGTTLHRQLDYWRRQLHHTPPLLELPTDHPRPPIQSYAGNRLTFALPADLTRGLHRLARDHNATLFMVLTTALATLLHRYSGHTDICIGTPVANRTRVETEPLIGFFVNTLVLRVDTADNGTYTELLRHVRDTALGAYDHQDLPFERLVQELQPQRSLSHSSLFQVMVNGLPAGDVELRLPEIDSAPLPPPEETEARFDLTLYVSERDGEVRGELVYSTALFAPARMDELVRQFRSVLAQAVADPDTPIGRFSLITPEAAAVLPDLTAPLEPQPQTPLVAALRRHAARTPDAVALAGPRGEWSYRDLAAAVDDTRERLLAAGIGRGSVVAIHAVRDPLLAVAVLSVLSVDGMFSILDAAYPPVRLRDYAEVARPDAWLAIGDTAEPAEPLAGVLAPLPRLRIVEVDGGHARRVEVETGGPALRGGDGRWSEVAPGYISYTSGSTGRPRAVVGAERSVTHYANWVTGAFDLRPTDRFAVLSGLSHDPFLRDFFVPLTVGARAVFPSPHERQNPVEMVRWMREQGVTVAHVTPGLAQLVAQTADADELDGLRYAFIAGDALTDQIVRAVRRVAPAADLVNCYGAMETPQAMAYHPVPAEDGRPLPRVLPLGRGIDGAQLVVLTEDGRLAGVGEIGELAIRSPYLAYGYAGDEEETARRFVPNPYGRSARDRMFRTGDLGRFGPDGVASFVRRKDRQTSVQGFRVEPAEVEAVIASHAAVEWTAVQARQDEAGLNWLVAAIVVRAGRAVTDDELRDWVAVKLPDFMRPASYVRLEEMPLTPNAKVDHWALSRILAELADRAAPPPAVDARSEAAVSGIDKVWREVLALAEVPPDANFFDVGGNSLLAVQMHRRLVDEGWPLQLVDVFRHPTVTALATFLAGT
ncbi:MAG TPA: amino acid adenylation domain-containing protein, partial [Micromonosporaceae bacterium]|nr:amino acid adenylation domain-containing protein [Micromonosporaceae bacterium]